GARSWSTAASSCRAAERSCWPTPKYAAPTSAPEGGRGVIAGAPPRQGFSYIKTGGSPRTVGAPEAGAKVFWLDSPFAPRAVLLHLNRGSPTPKPGSSRTVGAPAPGAKALWLDSLSHRGRCSYIQTGILLHQNRGSSRTVGAPAPGAKVLWLDSLFAPRAVLLRPNRDSPTSKPGFSSNCRSTRPGCEGFWTGAPGVSRRAVRRPDNHI